MEERKIVLVTFPQDKQKKLRPALVLRVFPAYGDVLLCGITSRPYQVNSELGIWFDEKHIDFIKSGLKKPGGFRLNMLTMVSDEYIQGGIGEISEAVHRQLLQLLAAYLTAGIK